MPSVRHREVEGGEPDEHTTVEASGNVHDDCIDFGDDATRR
jgi:hypothetical protein